MQLEQAQLHHVAVWRDGSDAEVLEQVGVHSHLRQVRHVRVPGPGEGTVRMLDCRTGHTAASWGCLWQDIFKCRLLRYHIHLGAPLARGGARRALEAQHDDPAFGAKRAPRMRRGLHPPLLQH